MSNSYSQANIHLREKIDVVLKSTGEIHVGEFISSLNQRYYAVTNGRITSLIRERDDVKRVKINHWILCK